jgi:hypothetical protein
VTSTRTTERRSSARSITTTIDRYGHLFDGHDTELVEGLDAAHDDAASPRDNVTRLPKAEGTNS